MDILANMSFHVWNYKTTRNLSLDKLAEELDMGRTTLYKCLRREWNPSVSTINYLAKQMGMTPEELLLPPGADAASQAAVREYLLQLKQLLEEVI